MQDGWRRSREGRNRSPLRALRHRTLAIYTAGNLISNTGTWFQSIASVILADHLSDGNTLVVGVVVFSQFAAVVLLAPWTGRAADAFDRKRLLVSLQAAAVVTSLALALLQAAGLVTVPVLVGMTLVLGITSAFSVPGLKAIVSTLVPPELVGTPSPSTPPPSTWPGPSGRCSAPPSTGPSARPGRSGSTRCPTWP